MASTVTVASHVEAFGGSGYKRTLASGGGVNLPTKRLAQPTSELRPAPTTFPATSARPDQRVNVRVPVTRASYSRLLPGQVAFVNRQFGKYHPGYKSGLGGLTPVASMEEVNDMLAQEGSYLSTTTDTGLSTRNTLFATTTTRSVYNHDGTDRKTTRAKVFFDAEVKLPPSLFLRKSKVDSQHPVMQFALDGLVATRVEEVDDLNTYSSASAQQACIVAVKGPAPMRLAPVPGETRTGVRESEIGTRIPAENVFLEPARIMAKVYVVLVAVFVDVKDGRRRFKLRYEVVSSSNLDVDPVFAVGRKLFRDGLLPTEMVPFVAGDRIVLRAFELGTVVDTAFGPAEQPQLTVCVHVTPLERVTSDGDTHTPVPPYELFKRKTRKELREERANRLGATGPSRLYRTDPRGTLSVLGARPFVTGSGGGIGAELKGVLDALVELQKQSLNRSDNLTKLVKHVFERGHVAHAAAQVHEKANAMPPTEPPAAKANVYDEKMRQYIASYTDKLLQTILAEYQDREEGVPEEEIRAFANDDKTKLDVLRYVEPALNTLGIQSKEQGAAYTIAVHAAIEIASSYMKLIKETTQACDEEIQRRGDIIDQKNAEISTTNLQNIRLKNDMTDLKDDMTYLKKRMTEFLNALDKLDGNADLKLKAELTALLKRGQVVADVI